MRMITGLRLCTFAILMLGLAGCGQTPARQGSLAGAPTPPAAAAKAQPASNEVDMTPRSFYQKSVTIHAGQAVHFVNQQPGSAHQLCLGHAAVCDANAAGPAALLGQGIMLQPGEAQDIVFAKPGTYQITCPLHFKMDVAVLVQ